MAQEPNKKAFELMVNCFGQQMAYASKQAEAIRLVQDRVAEVELIKAEKVAYNKARDVVAGDAEMRTDFDLAIAKAEGSEQVQSEAVTQEKANVKYETMLIAIRGNRAKARKYLDLAKGFASPDDADQVKAMEDRWNRDSGLVPPDEAPAKPSKK